MDAKKGLFATILEGVGIVAPGALAQGPHDNEDYSPGLSISNQATVDEHQRPEDHVPDVVLGSHDLVEHDKAPDLDEASDKDIVI